MDREDQVPQQLARLRYFAPDRETIEDAGRDLFVEGHFERRHDLLQGLIGACAAHQFVKRDERRARVVLLQQRNRVPHVLAHRKDPRLPHLARLCLRVNSCNPRARALLCGSESLAWVSLHGSGKGVSSYQDYHAPEGWPPLDMDL